MNDAEFADLSVAPAGAAAAPSGEPAAEDPARGPGPLFEPAAASGSGQAGEAGPGLTAARREELERFFFYGRRTAPAESRPDLIPALLHGVRDPAGLRYDYPLALAADQPEQPVRPLSRIIDTLLGAIAEDGDAGQILERHVYRIEAAIRRLAEAAPPDTRLLALWDRAAADLLARSATPEDKRELLRSNLDHARRALGGDYTLLGCGADTAGRLLRAAAERSQADRPVPWLQEIDTLIHGLRNILSVDFDHSDGARSPAHLRESAGMPGEEFDFEAMSEILSASPHGDPLPSARRVRIRNSLATLERLKPLFTSASAPAGGDPTAPRPLRPIVGDCAAALAEHQARLELTVAFFKAMQIARLELENRYRETHHDGLFDAFDATSLGDAELARCPPVLLVLDADALDGAAVEELLEILAGGVPLKVLVQIGALWRESGDAAGAPSLCWPARLAAMAMNLADVYVLQSSIAHVERSYAGFEAGLRYPGPALFCVYAGGADPHRPLPAYLDAAAAVEARVVPLLEYDPGRGETQAERVDLSGNSRSDSDWPTDALQFRSAAGAEQTVQTAFTPADVLLCEPCCAHHFLRLAPTDRDTALIPLDEFLALDAPAARERLPYLMAAAPDGELTRVLPDRALVGAVRRCRAAWRQLQELGGINNSFAANLVAVESRRLAEQKDAEIAALESQYQGRLEQDIGTLTEAIVGRIAAQLLGEAGDIPAGTASVAATAAVPPAGPAAAPAAEPEQAQPPAEEAEEADAELAVMDEAYIDTPLCTSCNECTELNAQIFAYDANKQAYVKDATAGPYKDLVRAAELCPVKIIHPGKPKNPAEPDLESLMQRAAPFL